MDADIKRYISEAFGTFVLVTVGVGAAVLAGSYIGAMGVALAFGLTLMAMAFVLGPISGCHINPAVTLGLFLNNRIDGKSAGIYMVAQVVGAIAGAALIWGIASGTSAFSLTDGALATNGYNDLSPGGYNLTSALLAEAVLTSLLVLTVLAMTSSRAPAGFAPIPIGLVLTAVIMVGIPVTNASINPARSIGPAVIEMGDALSQIWVFIVGPALGAALATVVWKVLGVADEASAARPAAASGDGAETSHPGATAQRRRARRK